MSRKSLLVLAFFSLIAFALPSCGRIEVDEAAEAPPKAASQVKSETDSDEIRILASKLEELESAFDAVSRRERALRAVVDSHTDTITSLEKKLDEARADVAHLSAICSELKTELDNVQKDLFLAVEVKYGTRDKVQITRIQEARHQIEGLKIALDQYYQDQGQYPADEFRSRAAIAVSRVSNENMVECLDGDGIQPKIPWSTRDDNLTPYYAFAEEDLNPWMGETQAYLDPWGNPFNYRENYSKKYTARHNFVREKLVKNWASFDIWSNGPDGMTNIQKADDPVNEDDICNWQ